MNTLTYHENQLLFGKFEATIARICREMVESVDERNAQPVKEGTDAIKQVLAELKEEVEGLIMSCDDMWGQHFAKYQRKIDALKYELYGASLDS